VCRSSAPVQHLNGRQQQQQQRSCSDLSGINYPGDLLSDAPKTRPRRAVPPPLVKRNTVADFANTKAYQASTASLISASEQGILHCSLVDVIMRRMLPPGEFIWRYLKSIGG